MNQTFEELAVLRDIHELWGVLGPQFFNFMNDSTNVAMLQVGRMEAGLFRAVICKLGRGRMVTPSSLVIFLLP